MSNKKIIFIIAILVLIFLLASKSFASEIKLNQGYVQITANVDEQVKKNKATIAVGICELKDDGYGETIYLYEMNNYTTNISLPEGLYEINYAMVDGDNENKFWFSADDTDFIIKSGSPAKMYFSIGNTSTPQKNEDNQEDIAETMREEENTTAEELPSETLSPEKIKELEQLGLLDLYNDDGSLNEEEVKKKYEEIKGEKIEETLKRENGGKKAEDKEEGEKNEGKMKGRQILDFILSKLSLILAVILGIILLIYKRVKGN